MHLNIFSLSNKASVFICVHVHVCVWVCMCHNMCVEVKEHCGKRLCFQHVGPGLWLGSSGLAESVFTCSVISLAHYEWVWTPWQSDWKRTLVPSKDWRSLIFFLVSFLRQALTSGPEWGLSGTLSINQTALKLKRSTWLCLLSTGINGRGQHNQSLHCFFFVC